MRQNYNSSLDKFTYCLFVIKRDRNKVPWKFWAVLERGKERIEKVPGRNFSKQREDRGNNNSNNSLTTFSYYGRFYTTGSIILTTDKASMAVFICKLY